MFSNIDKIEKLLKSVHLIFSFFVKCFLYESWLLIEPLQFLHGVYIAVEKRKSREIDAGNILARIIISSLFLRSTAVMRSI